MELSDRVHRLEREARMLRRCLAVVACAALVSISLGMAANEDQSLECTKLTFKSLADGKTVATIQTTDVGLRISRPDCEGFVTIVLHRNSASVETQWGESLIQKEATRAVMRAGTHGSSVDIGAGKDSPHVEISAVKYPNHEFDAFARLSLSDGVAEKPRVELVGSQWRGGASSATVTLTGRTGNIEESLDAK